MNPPAMTETDLHAYLDGQLPPERIAEVEAYLLARPEESRRLASYGAQKEVLRERFDSLLDEPLPAHLVALTAPPAAKARKSPAFLPSWSLQRIAAGLAIALLGGAAGWFGHARLQPAETMAAAPALSHQAAVAHAVYSPDVRRPVEVGAEQEEQLVKWLSKRLGSAVRVPKLGSLGYQLVGGRLLPGNRGPVAQFMYQAADGERLTLYASGEYAENRETGFRFAREGQINVFYWVDGKFGYALSGGIDKGELARIATAVYDQLEHP